MTMTTTRSLRLGPRAVRARFAGLGSRSARALGGIPRPLALLLAASAVLTVAWAFTTAPFQGPDEPAHFSYTQYMAETGHRPSVTCCGRPESSEGGGAIGMFNLDQLAGVADARPAWTKLEERRYDEILRKAPKDDGSGPNPIAKNPPLYYAYQVVPYYLGSLGDLWDQLIVMRLASGLLVLIATAFTWFAAAELFAAAWPRVIATGCVALLPQMTALGATINADALLITVWSAFTYVALRLARRGPTVLGLLALGALTAASLLTHGRGIAILPAFFVTVAVIVIRARPTLKQVLWRLIPAVALLAVAFGIYSWKLSPDTGAYGGEVVLSPSGGMSITGFLGTTWQFYFPRLPFMTPRVGPSYGYHQVFIESFFGRFASLEVAYPAGVYALIQLACFAGLAGVVAAIATRWQAVRARWAELAVLAALAVSMIGLLHLASYRSLVGSSDPLITGRYLLPLITVFGLTVAFVLTSVKQRLSAVLGTLAVTSLLALNLTGLMLTFARFYG
jgi:4-amino-4-deoxy-L-arabinose transferase-like glycosyltransferase